MPGSVAGSTAPCAPAITIVPRSKRICMTRLEWKARELNASVEDMGGVTTK